MGQRSKTRGRGRGRSQSQQGGSADYPASAWGNVLASAGNGWTQFMNTLSLNNPSQSNVLVLNNRNDLNAAMKVKPMSGGRTRGRGKTRSKGRNKTRSNRGGNIGTVFSQAAAPLALIGMNQVIGSRSRRRH